MNGKMNLLREILNRHIELHRELLELAEAKRRAIIANDAEKVEEITRGEAELVGEVEKTEVERTACVAQLAGDLNLDGTPKVQEIIDAIGETAVPLQESRDRLREILAALQKRTLQNERLLQQSIEHIKGFLRLCQRRAPLRRSTPVSARLTAARCAWWIIRPEGQEVRDELQDSEYRCYRPDYQSGCTKYCRS